MNTRLILTLLASGLALTLPSCIDETAGASRSKQSAPTLVITKPAKAETATSVADTLREALTQTAQASGGANVPNPHVSIIMPDGNTVDIPAPKVDGGVFGANSPKARQERLEKHLAAISAMLSKNCTGKPVPSTTVKAKVTALRAGGFELWPTNGTVNLWKETEKGPARIHADRDAFVKALAAGTDGQFLIITDVAATPAPKEPKSPGPKLAKGSKPETGTKEAPKPLEVTQAGTLGPPNGRSEPLTINVFANGKHGEQQKGATAAQAAPVQQPQPATAAQRITPSFTELPGGVEPAGKPILFAPGESKLTNEGIEAVKQIARMLLADAGLRQSRIFVVGKADRTLDKEFNDRLAKDRAKAVRQILWEEGVPVEDVVSVGEDTCPDDAPKAQLAAHRSVQVYALRASKVAALVPESAAPRP